MKVEILITANIALSTAGSRKPAGKLARDHARAAAVQAVADALRPAEAGKSEVLKTPIGAVTIKRIGPPPVPVSRWRCSNEGCHQTAQMTFAAIADVGTPICPDCGDDMELRSSL